MGLAAALDEPWSNGQTEGQITKLKLVKRQMYGRARLDLLRARLLGIVWKTALPLMINWNSHAFVSTGFEY